MEILTPSELNYLKKKLKREPNFLEKEIVGAQWSEHCSYKSSKKYIKLLSKKWDRIIKGPGYDAGIIDIGNGDVISVHIESHNHPSAVEPYGGAATGVGGIIRDIISMGTMPIALLNALRFGHINSPFASNEEKPSLRTNNESYSESKWLLKNVVRGIADYGNCIGIPTVGGEIEFDESFTNYCLVDVAAIGFGKRKNLIRNIIQENDILILAGSNTGRDGIHGASFASKKLAIENRSAVQIPDPFMEKLLMEVTKEAIESKILKAVKDLGGGGLSCCLSETSANLNKGFEIDLGQVPIKYSDMEPEEIMISESQERMLYITNKDKFNNFVKILQKYEVPFAVIGTVKNHKNLVINKNGKTIANMPSHLVAYAPLLNRNSKKPKYIDDLRVKKFFVKPPHDLNKTLLHMLGNPTIAFKNWIFQQFDHEIGLRTIVKPGITDCAVLKLNNNKFLAAKLDGNSKLCYNDPYQGTLTCLSEARANIICAGAHPIGIVDHLQFGNPENPEIFWSFQKSIEALMEFSNFNKIPIVGGKVSFYNETQIGPIKPSPVIGMLGLIKNKIGISQITPTSDDTLYIIGMTSDYMGGSEYLEFLNGVKGGVVPPLNLHNDLNNSKIILKIMKEQLISCSHDCSKGGLAIALAEMALGSSCGLSIDLDKLPNTCKRVDFLLFAETPSRFIIATKNEEKLENEFSKCTNLIHSKIGKVMDYGDNITFRLNNKNIINLEMQIAKKYYENISSIMKYQ
ncbi:MAG TPA: phosphoribosylformylglycinamidine synthase subunit PurL [Nitrososphaeraceae archaeon]|nr:phosphoribosylformylglycinamidine synthase subunit PurL [Nitrososphaeraceae archaeon]